jgi:hypothetical protein
MPKKSIADPVRDVTRNNRWKVTIPAGLSSSGKRVRSWHATREAARAYIDRIESPESPAATIPPKLAMLADEACRILEPWNLDIVQAAREVAAALETLGGAGTILEAAKAFRATHVARLASKPLGKAVAIYMDARLDLRPATRKSYEYTLEKTLAPLGSERPGRHHDRRP